LAEGSFLDGKTGAVIRLRTIGKTVWPMAISVLGRDCKKPGLHGSRLNGWLERPNARPDLDTGESPQKAWRSRVSPAMELSAV